jgi:hypothetical protein
MIVKSREVFGGQDIEIRSDVVGDVAGNGKADSNGEKPFDKDANGNKISLKIGYKVTGNMYGGYSDSISGTVRGNEVVISSGEVSGEVRGGDGGYLAENNKVKISSADITSSVWGGWSKGEAKGNVVEISSGKVSGFVIGGDGELGAIENKVKISSVDITSNVYGGWSDRGEARGNEVHICGSSTFSDSSIIYGGYSREEGAEVKRGNVLKLWARGIRVLGIENFERYEFYNPGKETEMVKMEGVLDLEESQVSINDLEKIDEAEVGNKYVLVRSSKEIKGMDKKWRGTIQEILARYDYIIEIEGGKELIAKINKKEVNPKSKGITESMVGVMGYVGEGVIRGGEMGNREEMRRSKERGEAEAFIELRGEGRARRREGRDIRGERVVGGVVKWIEVIGMMMGGYIEYGESRYKIKMEEEEVRVRGVVDYVGIGMIGEVEIKEGMYVGMGVRVGRYGSDGISEDMGIGEREGEEVRYENEGKYVGGDIGGRYRVGKIGGKVEVELRGDVELSHMLEGVVKMSRNEKVEIGGIGIKCGSEGYMGLREGIEGMLKMKYAIK